jgi:N6-adenosine-specific RNA methylase IME4
MERTMKTYQIIYADPPWRFKTYSAKGEGRSASQHYRVMDKTDIQNLPIRNISSNDCALFLWVTAPCLIEGIELIKAWGFEYKTVAFTWVKQNKKSPSLFWGMGYWTRANAEFCLLATRGNPKRISAGVHSVIMTPVEEHSKKPQQAREKIVALMGDIPRIELFARQKTQGWDVWGNEVESDVNL